MRLPLLLALLLLPPGPLRAQVEGPGPGAGRVQAVASIILKSSHLAGQARLHLGGWAGLALGDRMALGGGGLAPLESVELPGSEAGTGFHLRMGYGGIVLRVWEPLSDAWTAEGGLLLGAGNGEVQDRLSGRELGSDNFFVLEPEVALSFTPFRKLRLGAGLGYRLVSGVEDLPRVSESDLDSWSFSLFLSLGGR